MTRPVQTDAELARDIAEEAGALLQAIREGCDTCGKDLGDRGDSEANALILRRLREARPDDYVLSEESHDDRTRCAQHRVWIVDPLDGTRDYADRRCDWAVHIGLAVDGVPTDGAVAVPERGEIYSSDRRTLAAPRKPGRLRMVVSRTRAPELVASVAATLDAELVPMGSAGAKAMAVVRGDADIYLHAGGQYEWDNCAPVAVALAHGLHASRIDGSRLVYNCQDPSLPDLLICRPELTQAILDAI